MIPKGEKTSYAIKKQTHKGALNANINISAVISLKMLSISEIENKFILNQIEKINSEISD